MYAPDAKPIEGLPGRVNFAGCPPGGAFEDSPSPTNGHLARTSSSEPTRRTGGCNTPLPDRPGRSEAFDPIDPFEPFVPFDPFDCGQFTAAGGSRRRRADAIRPYPSRSNRPRDGWRSDLLCSVVRSFGEGLPTADSGTWRPRPEVQGSRADAIRPYANLLANRTTVRLGEGLVKRVVRFAGTIGRP
jgi:hypothetical protein